MALRGQKSMEQGIAPIKSFWIPLCSLSKQEMLNKMQPKTSIKWAEDAILDLMMPLFELQLDCKTVFQDSFPLSPLHLQETLRSMPHAYYYRDIARSTILRTPYKRCGAALELKMTIAESDNWYTTISDSHTQLKHFSREGQEKQAGRSGKMQNMWCDAMLYDVVPWSMPSRDVNVYARYVCTANPSNFLVDRNGDTCSSADSGVQLETRFRKG